MRAKLLLVSGLALLLGSCTGGGGHAPPPLHKDWLAGKWQNDSTVHFISGCEFGDDGAAKVTFQKMEHPVAAHYTWTGDRALDLEYQAPADVQQAYNAAAKAYKVELVESSKSGKIYERAVPSLSAAAPDELPAKETLQVAISEEPRMLFLTDSSGTKLTFKKVD
jgi:hypothetical protein